MLKRIARYAAVAALSLGAAAAAQAQDKVRLSFNPQIYSWLPLYIAVDKGYFKDEKLDVEVITYGGSALTQLPMLARGDQDIAGMVTGPGFFNQYAEGFGVKLIASNVHAKQGWHDTMWVMVRKDVWDTGKIKTLADLKGLTVELGPKGSPVYLTSTQAILQAGLKPEDVKTQERLRAVSDALPLFKNKAMDVITIVEPIVGRLEAEGLAVRWKPSWEVLPWFQESYLAANPKFLTEKRDVIKRFMKAYFRAAKEIDSAGGKWTPDLLASVVKWSKFPKEVIEAIPGPAHVGQMGKIDTASIERQQKIWMDAGLVKEKRPLSEMIDTTAADEARTEMGIK
jgi:NitT/TauT family transport system substrate-binding protein